MRVLHVHKDFEPLRGGGGTARHIHGLGIALGDLGHEVRVVSPAPEFVEGQPYHVRAATSGSMGEHVAWADVVHVHGARSGYAVAAGVRARLKGKPLFYTPHAFYTPHGPANALAKAIWDRTAEKFLLEKGTGTILLTEYWRSWLAERGISSARTAIIPNCILARDLIRPPADAPRLSGRPALLSVGRLDPVKRIDDVIRALADPLLAEAHFHVVGKGPQREELEALAAKMGVADRVTFHGFVDDAGVARMMGGSDVFVLASEQEGLPTVLLEALMAKRGVGCSRIPGNLAITGEAGVTSTYDVGDIAGIARVLSAPETAIVGDEAAARVERAFTWEHRATDILALYQRGLETEQRRA